MDREQVQKRVTDLRAENDTLNQRLAALAQQRDSLVQAALTNNGRILELERLLAEMQPKE